MFELWLNLPVIFSVYSKFVLVADSLLELIITMISEVDFFMPLFSSTSYGSILCNDYIVWGTPMLVMCYCSEDIGFSSDKSLVL